MTSWYIESGPESDVAISSRVRLARNLDGIPFPFMLNKIQSAEVSEKIRSAAINSGKDDLSGLVYFKMMDLPENERQVLVEKHLVSKEHISNSERTSLLLSRDERISIMINEEDHLRIQCLMPGMQVDNAWKMADELDTMLEKSLEYAYDNEYGYLTCCPTNVGTGIRASVMMHLPALAITGYIKGILEACSKLGVAIRGMYGENSEASGCLFQISNQVTMGHAEEEIISGIVSIANQINEQERVLRKEIVKQGRFALEDKIYRSYGIITNARIISTEEAMKLLSDIRFGVDMKILDGISHELLNELMLAVQPAMLQKISGGALESEERDLRRAEYIRSRLKNLN